MKPKQNKNNNKINNNNKRHKQQQQQQKTSVSDDVNTSKSDDVGATQTADTMTSSAAECPAVSAENAERYIPSNASDNLHSQGGTTDHVTDRCADDITSDVEVADILDSAPAMTLDPVTDIAMTSDPAVTEVVTSDPDVGEVTTELIMAKTFTESTHPNREFVPIRRDTDDVSNLLPGAGSSDSTTTLTVRCELMTSESTSGRRAMTSSGRGESVRSAVGQVRDLTSEFRHLQSLLDQLTSPSAIDSVDTSSEEELSDDWRQPSAESRVVYHYHLRDRPSTTRRWIRRTGTPDELNTQRQEHVVPHHETRLEGDSQSEEQRRTEPEESTTPSVQEDGKLRESEVVPVHEERLEHEDLNTQHQELVVEDASVKTGDVTEDCQSSTTI